MNPINFPESNRTYVKPNSVMDKQCSLIKIKYLKFDYPIP